MATYEYRTATYDADQHGDNIAAELNELGAEGFRLVPMVLPATEAMHPRLLFERVSERRSPNA